MSGVPYHAWTHRPKAQGGTDPLPVAGSMVYAVLSSVGNQTAQMNADNVYDLSIFPPTDGYSSDGSILEPSDSLGGGGSDNGILVSEPGFIVATLRCLGWDNWTGAGNEVLEAVKGCAPAFAISAGGDYLGVSYGLSNFASAVAGSANEGDPNTTLTDICIFDKGGANAYVGAAMIHSATVAALIQQVDLHVAWFAPHPADGGQVYTF